MQEWAPEDRQLLMGIECECMSRQLNVHQQSHPRIIEYSFFHAFLSSFTSHRVGEYIRNGINAESIKRKLIFLLCEWLVFPTVTFFSLDILCLEVFFVRFKRWKIGVGDTGTLLWTHVVLTINENSSRPRHNLPLILSRKNLFPPLGRFLSLEYSTKLDGSRRWNEMQYAFLRSPKTALQLWRKTVVFSNLLCAKLFWDDKVKEVIEVDGEQRVSKEKISKHWVEGKKNREKKTWQSNFVKTTRNKKTG